MASVTSARYSYDEDAAAQSFLDGSIREAKSITSDTQNILYNIASAYLPTLDTFLDTGYVPQRVIRRGIRYQLRQRESIIATSSLASAYETKLAYVQALRERPMAIETAKANEQHYEVGTGVLEACLGPRMKYSCCLYPKGKETLGQAEVEMLKSYVEKAGLVDGMKVLDLGCGWGSLSIYLAEIFPNSEIVGFSNSSTQKQHIDAQAELKGLQNLKVVTGDVVTYHFKSKHYDRVLSIELFEHMKNYELLMEKVAGCLKDDGKLFVHLFAHKTTPYDFDGGWMTEHFFTGGTMPSADLLLWFQRDLTCDRQWWVNGQHYARTCEDWLSNLTKNKKTVWPHLQDTYGSNEAAKWFVRWQVFYMACAELFGWEGGDTWGVCHYLFSKRKQS